MTKISYLRTRLHDEYRNRNLPQAADIGDALLTEHLTNNYVSQGYANDLYNVALVYDELGETEQAAAMYAASIRYMSWPGGRIPHTIFLHSLSNEECLALSMRFNNLAGALARMGDYGQAHDMYVWVRALNTRLPDHPQAVSDNLYNIANVAASAKNTDEAIRIHNQALNQRKQEGVPQDITNSLHALAHIYEEKGEYEKAIQLAESALEYTQGGIHASACSYLAELYELNGQPQKALELYETVLSQITSHNSMRRDYITILSRQAHLTGKTGDPQKAIKLHKDVFDMYNSLTNLDLETLDDSLYENCLKNMAQLLATELTKDPNKTIDNLLESFSNTENMNTLLEALSEILRL